MSEQSISIPAETSGLAPAPADEVGVRDERVLLDGPPLNLEAPAPAFHQLLTSAEHRFVRSHYPVPRLDAGHLLQVAGAVSRPVRLSLPALRRLPRRSLTVVTECAGNGRTSLVPKVPGEPWAGGAVSTARWTGAPLRALLEQAGLLGSAVELVFTGADSGAYQRSLPREAALDPTVLLAWEMNGAPIPPLFGGPLRLVVPGWYGMASVKWLARIEAVERPFFGLYQTEKYLYAPGVPVTRIRPKSMFTGAPGELRAFVPARICGLAWSGEGVARVDVFASGRWQKARLLGPPQPHAWRRFELLWTPAAPGRQVLRCRAVDGQGEIQPERPVWNPAGYGANGIQQVEVVVR